MKFDADLVIIGAGSAGLSVAAGAVQIGARVVLIEGGEMGGDCLNTGCVPSKALIEAARRAKSGLLEGEALRRLLFSPGSLTHRNRELKALSALLLDPPSLT